MTPLEKTQDALLLAPFARLDVGRYERQGFPEAIFCPGKTTMQIQSIFEALKNIGQPTIATRITDQDAAILVAQFPDATHHREARLVCANPLSPSPDRPVVVACAGTGDLPVAEEAAVTAETLGCKVDRLYDVGVAGLYRLLSKLETLRKAKAVVVCAGMDGALPSVVGGLVACPVIAVPTSIGYGAHMEGIASLLTMLNSCAANVSVVNIDNGFGAGISASLICR